MVRLRYYDSLSAAARKRLDRLIRFAVQGIRRHRVGPAQTNLFLMKAANCLLIGEATDQPHIAAEGSRMLDAWLMTTYEHGLGEFLSPAYYGVDVTSLGLIARYVKDPAAKAKAETALKLFWTDIAANWFEPGLRLGGPRSKDFDRLTGHGYLDNVLARLGWIPTDPRTAGPALLSLSAWEPPAGLTRPILSNLPRTVCRRWGPGNGAASVTYVGKGVCVGTSGAGFGPMDKVLTVDLGGGPTAVVASFLMDGLGDPYGRDPRIGGGGHTKSLHLTPFVATVQRGPEALLLASADTADKDNFRHTRTPNCLLSHLILPKADEVWIAGRKVTLDDRGDAVAVFPGEPLFVRLGKAALAVRVLLALDTAGNPAAVALFADGGKLGAMRLTVTHSPDAPEGSGHGGPVGPGRRRDRQRGRLRDLPRSDSANWEPERSPTVASSSPHRVVKGKLRIFADIWKQRAIELDGGERCPPGCVLSIDGQDRGKRLLADADIVSRYLSLLRAKSPGQYSAGQIMEAESADLVVPPFVMANNNNASGGRFVWVPKSAAAGSTGPARVLWTVNIPADGMYALAARVWTPAGSRQPFAVRIRQRGQDVLDRTAFPTVRRLAMALGASARKA